MTFRNPCGGLRWETLSDGTIEIEGAGVAAFEPGSAQFQQLEQCWANWGGLIATAAGTHGIPPSWSLSIMRQETGLWSDDPSEQEAKVAPDGGLGLMQIMPGTAKGFGADPTDMLDAEANIAVGSALLGKLAPLRGNELPEVAASYNAGGVRCGYASNPWNMVMSNDYVGNVIRGNNAALLYLDMRRPPRLFVGLALAAVGVYAGAVIAGLVAPPKGIRAWTS